MNMLQHVSVIWAHHKQFSALEILDYNDDDLCIHGTLADCYRLIKIVGNESPG
jgi:hypothetical protein